ncbi:MFS transporter [Streptomyces litchfieldiae]|uniref:MFS transporter n=1 Tax=Streptomyces litchfieldiae TaxID=3075543 RepID=A0ABU2MUU0_9ACTN|nr:MFS transporter [Streptomyces sp. DSM 44938]MDT0345073.1 MFS transporter [Streptomyces sp. DSM 44938]
MSASQTAATTLTPARRRGVLAVVLVSLAVVVSAVPSLNVALPDLAKDTGANQTQLQWIVDAYALVFAGLLLPAGAIGDRFGRRPVLVAGLALFAAGAFAAAAADEPGTIIVLRGLSGVGAALVMPTTLSIITSSFPAAERGKAVGAWIGVAGAGAVFGLLTSGLLLEWFSWPSIFVFGGVLAALTLLAAVAVIPNSRDITAPRIDAVSGLLSALGLAGIVYGTIEGPHRGWTDAVTLTAFAIGLLGGALWLGWSLRTTDPMLDPRLFRVRGFATGVLSITVQFFVFFGMVFIVLQYLQLVLDYTALQAGLAMTPMGLVLGGLSRRAPHIVGRIGQRRAAGIGLVLMTAGVLILSRLDAGTSYWPVLAGLLPIGAGMALATAPATTSIVDSLPAHKQGVASAVNDAAREVGGTLGIAVLGSVLNNGYRQGISDNAPAGLPPEAVHAAQESLAVSQAVAERLGAHGEQLGRVAIDAFIDGYAIAYLASAVLLTLTAAAILALGSHRAAGHTKTAVDTPRSKNTPDADTLTTGSNG